MGRLILGQRDCAISVGSLDRTRSVTLWPPRSSPSAPCRFSARSHAALASRIVSSGCASQSIISSATRRPTRRYAPNSRRTSPPASPERTTRAGWPSPRNSFRADMRRRTCWPRSRRWAATPRCFVLERAKGLPREKLLADAEERGLASAVARRDDLDDELVWTIVRGNSTEARLRWSKTRARP